MKTPDYTLTLKDGSKKELLFHTWMYRYSYCPAIGIEYDELLKRVNGQLQNSQSAFLNDIPQILLSAHETFCKYNNEPFTDTLLDACDWVEELGGMVQNLELCTKIYTLFISKLVNIDPEAIETKVEEKKSTASA